MDTSETYIKMCDCEEIQQFRKPKLHSFMIEFPWQIGDYGWDGKNAQPYAGYTIWASKDVIWLPRQDQLQEMIRGDWDFSTLVYAFNDFITEYKFGETSLNYELLEKFTSMEQLWLAFAMRKKSNKSWDGKKWVR